MHLTANTKKRTNINILVIVQLTIQDRHPSLGRLWSIVVLCNFKLVIITASCDHCTT